MTPLNRNNDPRIEAFYRKQRAAEVPKWVMNNQLYKNWLFSTGQLDELKDFKKARRVELREVNRCSYQRKWTKPIEGGLS